MKEKWTPHIIAVTALTVFIVLGLACASTPKTPQEIVFDSSIPQDQTATLFIPAGTIEVFEFNGVGLKSKWYQPSLGDGGMNVRIPSGIHEIGFHYYGGGGANVKNIRLNIDVKAGRAYRLFPSITASTMTRETVLFTTYELSETREPNQDEQLLFITDTGKTSLFLVVLDKDTDEKRSLVFYWNKEIRVVVPKGDHTMDFEFKAGVAGGVEIEPTGEPPRTFTASSDPVRYSVAVQSTGRGKDAKWVYTLTRN
jgi:hypothetical protein